MASIENRTGYYNIVFRFGGEKFTRSLKTKYKREAIARKARLEENIRLVESGRLEVPIDADAASFLLSDGKVDQKIALPDSINLNSLFEQFFQNIPQGNLEESTLNMMKIHQRHLVRLLGRRFQVQQLTLVDLQQYVNQRMKEKGQRGRTVGATTIKKEIVTFSSAWNWALHQRRLHGEFPRRGLRLPKTIEKPAFLTWEEIEKQIKRGKLTAEQQADLWDCLYLTLQEIQTLLEHVRDHARHPFLYPMFVMAAHTGARRSEMLRSQIQDFDEEEVIIRERKRVRGQHSTRRVPLSPTLRAAMEKWIGNHPGGNFTFCLGEGVDRSKKKRQTPQPATRDEAHDHFKRTLRGSKWEKISGWHCLRHSFISNLASKGIDQRLIDSYVGHTTEAMRRRYTHLFPDTKRAALRQVFE